MGLRKITNFEMKILREIIGVNKQSDRDWGIKVNIELDNSTKRKRKKSKKN